MIKTVFFYLVMHMFVMTLAHGRHLKSYIPSTWINKCLITCPKSPLDACDFYFQGFLSKVPVFDYGKNSSRFGNDTILTPAVLDKYLNRTVDIHTTTRPACYLNNKNVTKFTNMYYASGIRRIGHVMVNKSATTDKCDEFCGKCVLLYMVQARPHWPDGSFTELLSGDNNTVFPESRRCVVFKTTSCY